jgi:type VI secretion system protein ImpH
MAADGGRGGPRLSASPGSTPRRFDLLAAVRTLEAAGTTRVHFRAPLAPVFAPCDVEAIADGPGGPVIESAAVSLFGPNGPLPASLAEAVDRSCRRGEHGPRAFLDLFGDRLTRAFVDLLRLEWPSGAAVPPARSAQAIALRALAGRAEPAAGPAGFNEALLAHAGLLHQRPRSLHAAAAILAAVFDTKAAVRGLVGGWTTLEPNDQARLSAAPGGTRLGHGAALGRKVWLKESGVTIELGPMAAQRFHALSPGGADHGRLGALATHLLPPEAAIDCRLTLTAAAVPAATLGRVTRLGWSSWLARTGDNAVNRTTRFRLRPEAAA